MLAKARTQRSQSDGSGAKSGVRTGAKSDVRAQSRLRSARSPEHIGPEPGKVGPGGIGSDVLLVAEEGKSGFLLEYNHLGNADEYELRSWGRFARSTRD